MNKPPKRSPMGPAALAMLFEAPMQPYRMQRDPIHKPMAGGLQLAAMRAVMRFINAVPPLKRHIMRKTMRVRGEN